MAEINWDDFRPVGAAPKQDEQDVDWGQFTPVGSAKNGQGQGDGILRKTGDLGLSLLSGAVAVPEAAVGLADLASGGRAGKFLENEGGSFGFRPKEAKEAIQGWQSDSLKQARQDFSQADGITGKAVTALQNPSLISNAVAESLPLMGAMMVTGGSAGAAAAGGATRLATSAPTVARGLGAIAKAAPYIGEGLASAGSAAEQIRQESKDGLLTGKQSALAAASGIGTGLLGAVGNKTAGMLGISDLDVAGAQAVAKELGAKIASEGAEKATNAGLIKRLVGGAISEGLLEELPQSVQEQILQNIATGKDWREDLTDSAVMGAITGGIMGGGFNLLHSGGQTENASDEKPQPQGLGLRQLGYSPDAGAMTVFPDGSIATNSEQELERRYRPQDADRQQEAQPEPSHPLGLRQLGYQPTSDAPTVFPDGSAYLNSDQELTHRYQPQEATKPSERLGLNPADGPNSAAAVVAVDSIQAPSAINAVSADESVSDGLALNAPRPRIAGPANTGAGRNSGNAIVLQNRDRSTAASVAQMNAIASNPDYLRTGASRTMDTGAPVVFGDLPAGAVTGRTEMVADGRGARIRTQYAVVDAGDVLTSNQADGSPVAEYAAGAPGKLRAVAGNARTAGLAEAYHRNTADTYKQELAQDATSLGIDPVAVAAMQAPILVRIMDAADVTADIGDRSNVAGTARLSAVEEAANDARHVDIGGIVFDDNGTPSTQSVLGFIHSMPESERSNMLNADGTPTRQAIDRIMAATFKQAYDSDSLVQLYAQATDPQARAVMSALADAAGAMSALDGAGEFDIRAAVADAAGMAVNAARRGLKLSDVVRESDIDVSPEAFVVAQFLADNIRSGKRMAEGLRAWAQLAQQQLAIERDNASQGGLFDARPTLTREQLLQGLGNGNTATAETSPDAGGPESAAEGAQRPEAEPGRNGRGATNGAERGEPATGTKQPRSGQQERLTDEAARPKGWRNNMPGAAKVARDLGIDPRQHKTVASLVAAIDAADQQAGLQTKAPASVPTVEDKAPGPQPSQTEKARSEKAAPPADASGKTQADRIEDFGEKIGGARKDVWAGFKDGLNAVKNADIASEPFSKIWPVPDYQKLIDDGMSAEAVATIRAMRDEIPVKPRASWKVKRWAQQVQALRDFANDVLNGTYTLQQIKDMAGSKAVLGKVFGRIDLYQAVGHGQSLQGVNLAFHHYTIYKGKENVSLWVVEQDVKATAWSNWPRELATGETKEAAIAAFKKKLATLDINTPDKKETSFEIYSRRGEKGYWIGKKVGRNPIFLEGPFDSVKEARAYKDANNAKLVDKLEQAKQIPNERRETNEPRVGEDHRAKLGFNQLIKALVERANADAELVSNSLIGQSFGTKPDGNGDVPGSLGFKVLSDDSGSVDSALRKNPAYMAAVGMYALRNISKTVPISVEGFGKLDVPSRRVVQEAMALLGKDHKVLRSVISLVPIDVMDLLSRHKISAEDLLLNESVLKALLPVDGSVPVSGRGALNSVLSFVREIATRGAEVVGTNNPAWIALKNDPAVKAGEFDSILGKTLFSHDVTPEDFQEAFSFKGVQFGNWVEQGKRQQDLNEAFDALMDMAAILNVPPRALSLNGELGIAFGARGKGGKNSAKAHYEPGFVAINLTKKEGAGSLGHEWWHALDNYFSRMRDKGQGMMTEALDVSLSSKGSRFEMNSDKVRQEMIVAFGDVVRTIRQTAIQARSSKLDAKRSKEYWTTQPEMSARAFESYLISKLQDQNASNDYLANIVSPETWKAAEALGFELDGSYPYPTAGEIPAIRSAFDRFFQTVETKETDKGVALFSQQTKAESRTSDNAANQGARDGQQHTASGIPTGLPSQRTADSDRLGQGINADLQRIGDPGAGLFRASSIPENQLPDALRRALGAFRTATGTRVHIFRNLTPEILDFNGVNFRDGTVHINENSQNPATLTAAHEWVHNLRRTNPDLYGLLADEVARQGLLPEYQQKLRRDGETRWKNKDVVEEELTAAAVSDAMTDPAFLQRLSERDQGMFRRVARAFLDFLNTLTSGWRDQGSNAYLRDVEAFRDKLADVLAAYESNSAGPGSAETLKSAWANFITETKTPITSVPTGATGNSGAFDGRNADIRFSRSQETQQAYEARIDALFAGDKPSARGTRVLDKSDVLDLLGASKGGIHLVEGKVVAGQDNHPFMTAQQWKQVPQWLDNPAMVFESDTVAGRLVFIGPELVNESPVRMIVDPRPEGDGVNLLINAYDAQVNPFSRWARDGLLRYYDKQKAPNVAGSFQPQLTGLPGSGGRKKILTEKNLAGYRKEQMADGSPKFIRPLSGPQALQDANGLLRLEMRAGIDGNNPLRVMKAARQAVASLQEVRQRSGSPAEKRLLSSEIEGMHVLERSILGSMRMRAENSAVNSLLDKGPQKLSTLMNAVASATKSPDIAELAQRIASVAGDVTVDRARNDAGTMGKYSTVQRQITLARGANGISANTLLHEGVHAATAHALIERPLLRRRAQALLDHAIAKNPSIKAEYGSRDVFEFVAEAMTNAGFQAKLRSVSPTSTLEGKSLWQNFVSMVRKALALPEKHQSALDQVMTLTGELMQEQQRGAGSKAASGPDLNYSIDRDTDAKAPPENTRFDDFVYKMQNKQIDLKRITEWIEKTFGKISDDVNAYLKETLFKGRAAARTKEFAHNELEPLMRLIASSDLSIGDVEEFLHARHAKEANQVIAQRNPDNQEFADGGSGMKNAEAERYFANLAPAVRAKLEAVAKQVDTIIEGTRQLYVEYGLEDQGTVNGWKELFKHYIPLMREGKDGVRGIGQGFSVRGKETKGRTGSTRKVVDVLANIVQERERAITRGEKNIVATAMVGLVKEHPINGFWSIQTQPPKTDVFDPRQGKVVQRIDPLYRSRDNVLVAKVRGADGKVSEVSIEFNEDNPRARRMAQALKNLDSQSLEGLLGASAKLTRYFSAINTQYNPLFGPVNLLRDVQSALLNLSGTPLAGQQAKIAADTVSALADVFKDMRRMRDGKAASTKWGQMLRQFELDGGTTGYMDMFKTSADRAKALEKMLNPDHWMESGAGKLLTANGTLKAPARAAQAGFGAMLNWLEDYNNAMENSTRLAVYQAAINQGMSRDQAAGLAKNITVNFNRKGQAAQQVGAMYAFFNAAMQGSARIGQLLFTMEGGDIRTLRLSKSGKTIVYGGLVLGVLQALALSAAGFDDEEPPEYVRERSLVIPTGNGKYVTIPMPLGYHVIPGVSRHLTEWALGGFEKTPKRMASMIGMFADAFNPIGNAGLSLQTIAPTPLDPLVALAENKDYTGREIARRSRNTAEPGHIQGKDTSTWVAKTVAEAVNWITGGNEYKAGVFSPTPDQIDYLIGQATGGVGREVSKAQQTITAMATGEELPPHKIPGVSRFYGDTTSQSAQANRFYRTLERVNELETEVNGLRKDGRSLDAIRLMRESPYGRLIQPANQAERQMARLRKAKREALSRGDSEGVKAREEQMTTVMRRLTSLAQQP